MLTWTMVMLFSWISSVINTVSQDILAVSLFISIAYALGWVDRWIWYLCETEWSKLLHGTPITVGGVQADLLRGRLWASNVVIHSPQRQLWKWESPILARVGQVYVETNLVRVLLCLFVLREEYPLEFYTVRLSDVQVFVERRKNIFNFHLLDKHVELPDPRDLMEDEEDVEDEEDHPADQEDDQVLDEHAHWDHQDDQRLHQYPPPQDDDAMELGDPAQDPLSHSRKSAAAHLPANTADAAPGASSGSAPLPADAPPEEKAQQLMQDMVRALGRAAANQGSWQGALSEHRQALASQLRLLRQRSKKSQAMQEGVQIVQQVSKAVVQKTQHTQQAVLPHRIELADDKIVYGRIGRVLILETRIFTRARWEDTKKDERSTIEPSVRHSKSSSSAPKGRSHKDTRWKNTWNKPIYIQKVAVRASELCPPLSAKDPEGLPALYQPLDRCLDVVLKRMLAEVAKTNTGRLLRTAMGEVLDFWMEKDVVAPANSEGSTA